MRDPRTDPKPGDVLTLDGFRVEVEGDVGVPVYSRVDGAPAANLRAEWPSIYATAEVVTVAP